MGWSTPQEDEFALLALGARSPYEGLLVPRAFEEAFRLADPEELPDREKRRWEAIFCRFLRGLSWINAGRPLLLKSPAHGYRVRTIKKILPTAKFIVIVRDPYETLESMVNAYKAFARRFGLAACLPDDDIREAVIRERIRFETKLTGGLINHPSHRVVYIKYENLVTDPVETIQGIYRRLRLPDFEHVRPSLVTELVKRGGYVKQNRVPNAYWGGRLEQAWGHIFAQYGYRVEKISAKPSPQVIALDAKSTSIALGAKHAACARTSSGVTSSAERGSM